MFRSTRVDKPGRGESIPRLLSFAFLRAGAALALLFRHSSRQVEETFASRPLRGYIFDRFRLPEAFRSAKRSRSAWIKAFDWTTSDRQHKCATEASLFRALII